METISLDMRGKPCPIPVIEAKKAIGSAAPGDTVAVLVDNDVARQNLQKMAEGMGHGFKHEPAADSAILVSIRLGEGCSIADPDGEGLVVAIGRDAMGHGSDELGRNLMKAFIFSLTELDTPPEHLVFYNGGAALTCEGSAALADLATLEKKGTVINTCGTCLNFFGITDKLQIGAVTNMFAIASTMAQGKRLINL